MFKVFESSTPMERDRGTVGSYVVTDRPDDFKGDDVDWPIVVRFVVSMRHDRVMQRRRAIEYADYLNRGIVIQPPI